MSSTALAEEDEKQVCSTAAEEAQTDRAEGRLIVARKKLVRCAQETCPGVVREACTEWLAEVDKEQPSIVLRAADATGGDLSNVTVESNGAVLVSRLDGNPITLDPSAVKLTFKAEGYEPKSVDVVIARGEKSRVVRVTLERAGAPRGAADKDAKSDEVSPGPFVFMGLGGAMLVTFAVLQGIAQAEYADLQELCGATRTCNERDVSPTRGKFLASLTALGAGVLLTGVGITWWVISSATSSDEPVAQVGVSGSGIVFRTRF